MTHIAMSMPKSQKYLARERTTFVARLLQQFIELEVEYKSD